MNKTSVITIILAIIGALAWLPHILRWIYAWLIKPKLRFVPESKTEIGYNVLGLIFNQNFAIVTEFKNALIERILLTLTHESGEKHEFIWKSLHEKGFEVTDISGVRAEYSKLQPAIALKVWVIGLVEKKILFRDYSYEKDSYNLLYKLIEKQNHIKKVDEPNYKGQLLKSKELSDFLDFVKKSFYWKQGKYTIILYASEKSLKKPHVENFEFTLTKSDSERLERNIEFIQQEIKNQIEYEGIPYEKWPTKPNFNWINPNFQRKQ